MKFATIAFSSLVSAASVALIGTSQALAAPTIDYVFDPLNGYYAHLSWLSPFSPE